MNVFSWWNHLPYEHPDLWALLNHWPFTVFVPIVVLGVLSLATVTRISDSRDRHEAGQEAAVVNPVVALDA